MIYTKHHIEQMIRARDSYSFFRTFLEHRTNPKIELNNPVIENGDYESTLPYLLWYTMFNPNKTVICGFPTYQMAKHILKRAKEIHAQLPGWMALEMEKDNGLIIAFKNGSRIFFRAMDRNFGRGFTINKLYLYEMGMLNHALAMEVRASCIPMVMFNHNLK